MCKEHLANLTEDPEPVMRAEGEESALEPKVMESHEPIPGRVPRKVEIQRKRIKYASFDLRKGLAESQTVRSWIADNKHWIRLELVDDEAFEDYTPSEWLEKAGEKGQASAKMVEIKASGYTIQNCIVNSYDPGRKEYTVTIEDGTVKPAKRIEICFNAEDPRKYLSRIESAILCAQNAAVKLKYHYFIDKMLTDKLFSQPTFIDQLLLIHRTDRCPIQAADMVDQANVQ